VLTAVSTGVLTRTLQLAWPDAAFYGVAVARNLHPGEIGVAQVKSYWAPFSVPSIMNPNAASFSSEPTYDLKAWECLVCPTDPSYYDFHNRGRFLFWNVAGQVRPRQLTPADIDSAREWGEVPR
jgi:hypothetical protein